jgi:hypothetical protein
MKAMVISGFPGVGKSYVFKNNNGKYKILDSDSSNFSWIEKGVRNPDFPNNYIQHIKENLDKVDVIFVSSHEVVRNALKNNNIKYTIIYPNIYLKAKYLENYRNRGNNFSFINMINENWDKFIIDIMSDTYPNKIELSLDQYIKDIKLCRCFGKCCSDKTGADNYENFCKNCLQGYKGHEYGIKL